MGDVFRPGVKQIKIAATGTEYASPVTFTEHQINEEQSTFPDVQALKAPVGSGEEGQYGEEVVADIRLNNVAAADVTTLRTAAFALTGQDVEFTSKDGKTVGEIVDCLLVVNTSPFAKGDSFGYVRIQIKKRAVGSTAVMGVTYTA